MALLTAVHCGSGAIVNEGLIEVMQRCSSGRGPTGSERQGIGMSLIYDWDQLTRHTEHKYLKR